MNKETLRARALRWWRKDIRPLLVMALILCSLRSSLADWNDVPTGSMKPTILEGDRVWVNKLAYDLKLPFTTWRLARWGDPRRGDVVVFFSPRDGARLVKRVVGIPGDILEMRDEQLILNGEPVRHGPLSADIAGQLPETERLGGVFATELLPGAAHPVMAIPRVAARRTFDTVRVPEGHYFMMGDNRDNSLDSRYYGPVERKQIVGRATAVVLSLDRENGWLPRWQRSFTSLRAE